MFGAERALKEYNGSVYAKASTFSAGVDWDTYYRFYFATADITADTDKNGKTVSGSRRKKVVAAINSLGNIPRAERLLLLASRGYSLSDGDFGYRTAEAAKKALLRYIFSLKITREEKAELAAACGFTVKGNKISLK